MKIGLVCPYDIFRGGGVQEVVLALQKGLNARGHSVKIITPLPRDNKNITQENIIFIGTSTDVKSPFHTTAQISVSLNNEEIKTMLAKENFDLLNFHEPWVPIMSRQLLTRSKCLNVATFHAKLPETVMSKTIEKVITPYSKSVLKYLNELTAVSDAAAEYVKTLTRQAITIIPNGINLAKYKTNPSHIKPSSKNKNTILYIGRLEKRKGIKYLIRAFGELVKNNSNLSLIIAGEGPDRQKLATQVKNNKIQNIKFVGYVTEAQKLMLLTEADLFCSPALYGESFGIVLLEAMASGVVTVAGNNSGYISVLKEMGEISIINPKDTNEFARRLHLLLFDQHLRDLWQKWAKDYVKQYSYTKIIDKYEALFNKSIKTSK